MKVGDAGVAYFQAGENDFSSRACLGNIRVREFFLMVRSFL